jgi:hypothetical protein
MAISGTAALVASSVVSAVSAGVSYMQADAQKDAQEAYNEQLERNAIESYAELDKQEADVIEANYKESMQAQREYMQARSSIELQAAASGTYGQSIDLAIEDLNTGLGQRMTDITSRKEMQLDNIDVQAKNIANQAKAQADYTVQPPAYYQAAMTGLSTFQRTYGSFQGAAKASREGAKAQ